MNPSFWKRFFLAAAVFNFGAALGFAIPARACLRLLFGLENPEPAVLFLYWLFLLMVGLMGIGYGLVGLDIRKNRAFVQVGALGKILAVSASLWAWQAGIAGTAAVMALSGDIVWAVMFCVFLAKTGGLFSMETRIAAEG